MTREEDAVGGAQQCVYGVSGNFCRGRAVLHVWIEDGEHTFTCAEHASWWNTHIHGDEHPVGGACGLPDTYWIWSRGDEPGKCIVEGLDLSELAGFALAGAPCRPETS